MGMFEKVQNLLGCEFISDIGIGKRAECAKEAVACLDLNVYPIRELQDMAEYLYEKDCSRLNKDEVIFLLKQPNNFEPLPANRAHSSPAR